MFWGILLIVIYVGWSLYLAVKVSSNTNWALGFFFFVCTIVYTPLLGWLTCKAVNYFEGF